MSIEIIPPRTTSGGITQLTGDVTAGPGSGSQAATLANTAVTPGSYGDSTHVSQITVDSKGRITAAASTPISGIVSGAGGLIGIQTITATGAGTYTPTTGTTFIIIELVGGGGGGAGVASAGANHINYGGGGSGGGYLRKKITSAFSGAAYVVGAKGTGGSAGNNAGNNGADTTFTQTGGGTVYTAGKGLGGSVSGGALTPPWQSPATVAGGVGTNGDINIPGGRGLMGYAANIFSGFSAAGGNSHFSAGAPQNPMFNVTETAGINADGYGGGGGGGAASNTASTGVAGGNGSDGIIIIWEYS